MTEVTSTIEDRVRKVVVEHTGIEAEKVVTEARFHEDLDADSLDVIEITMALELEFDVVIPDSKMDGCATFGDAVTLMEKHLAGGQG